jgi:hypothetical protein
MRKLHLDTELGGDIGDLCAGSALGPGRNRVTEVPLNAD